MKAIVIDAGVGNLGNLRRALEFLGAEAVITSDPSLVLAGQCLLLPGVGAFRPPRQALRGPLEAALRCALDGGSWLLGICVGFQLAAVMIGQRGDISHAINYSISAIIAVIGNGNDLTVLILMAGQEFLIQMVVDNCIEKGILDSSHSR